MRFLASGLSRWDSSWAASLCWPQRCGYPQHRLRTLSEAGGRGYSRSVVHNCGPVPGRPSATLVSSPTFLPGSCFLPGFRSLLLVLFALPAAAHAATRVQAAPVPAEMRSTAFTVKVNGQPVDVAHAAASYEFVSFDITGPVNVEITAAEAASGTKAWIFSRGGWDCGRSAQRARRSASGSPGPAKLSISRPGDFLNHAAMLFLFAGTPPPPPPHRRQCSCCSARACITRA